MGRTRSENEVSEKLVERSIVQEEDRGKRRIDRVKEDLKKFKDERFEKLCRESKPLVKCYGCSQESVTGS